MKAQIEKNTETINLVSYNIHGQKLEEGSLVFDFDNNTITTKRNTYIIKNISEYTFKLFKKEKAIGASRGIQGLFEFINDINNPKSAFNPFYTSIFIAL